ncbi:DUF6356 family protein [Sphingobium sp.]|uniref:DUF6356 family protein n=1 Tax=Sphingobium sp. TaxID=1912891 RepID=UPI0028BE9E0E|nr:DUF6356 family protein [Sphingobium sp.]
MSVNPFTDHPGAIGETYFEHMRAAAGFGIRMVAGGIACLCHGLFPFLFTTTGSDQIQLLHRRMVTHRVGEHDNVQLTHRQAR